jgi:hypothetical protein
MRRESSQVLVSTVGHQSCVDMFRDSMYRLSSQPGLVTRCTGITGR